MSSPDRSAFTILHLGLGAFHRAHQAYFLERLRRSGDARWELAGGNIRPDAEDVVQALQAQGGQYTLETMSASGECTYTRIASIRRVVPHEPSLAGLVAIGAEPATRIISFTVTEAGYHLDAAGNPDPGDPVLAADLALSAKGLPGRTIYGAVATILRARMAAGAGAVTLLCCDNLRHNGERFRRALLRFVDHLDDAPLRDFVAARTTCPNTMVDRITPRPTPAVRARVLAATGVDDAAAVMAESFIQWVIEDDFCNGRPAWESVGAELVARVAPYEEAKIRILNATHSCIAWGGTLAGTQFIDDGVRHPEIRRWAHDFITGGVIPCLEPSPVDLRAYRDTVLGRFGNAAIADTNQRVAADSFSKIPGFITPTVQDCLARGAPIAAVAVLPALFLAFLMRWHRGELPYVHQDRSMDPVVAHTLCSAPDPVAALVAQDGLWGRAAHDPRLVAGVREAWSRVDTVFGNRLQR